MKPLRASKIIEAATHRVKQIVGLFYGRPLKSAVEQSKAETAPDQNAFLLHSKGVLHIGANLGQERDLYATYRLPVVWFEALPDIFDKLRDNLIGYPNQTAI